MRCSCIHYWLYSYVNINYSGLQRMAYGPVVFPFVTSSKSKYLISSIMLFGVRLLRVWSLVFRPLNRYHLDTSDQILLEEPESCKVSSLIRNAYQPNVIHVMNVKISCWVFSIALGYCYKEMTGQHPVWRHATKQF